ncbi:MAG: hypothetical protein AAGD32_12460, partial [Planctomycetota bacterium]
YEVTDNQSGKTYVTKDGSFKQNRVTGTARFVDLKTGANVVLQEYEWVKIPKEEAQGKIAASRTAE